MNARDAYSLIEKLKALPPQRQAEVEDFVDFLRSRDDDRHLVAASIKPVLTTLDKRLVRRSLGRLHEIDRAALKVAVQTILG